MAAKRVVDWHYLSPIDNLIPPQYVRQVLCFASKHPGSGAILKRGLEKTIATFPSLTASVPPGGSLKKRLDGPFYTANQIITDDHTAGKIDYDRLRLAGFPNHVFDNDTFIPPMPPLPMDTPAPVMRVRLTQVRGGIVLGLCLHHSVADLAGTCAILRTWAQHCRDPGSQLEVDSSTADRKSISRESAMSPTRPEDIHHLPPPSTPGGGAQIPDGLTAMYCMPDNVIRDLKAEVSAHLESRDSYISTNDVICAVIWSATTKAIGDLVNPDVMDGDAAMGLSVNLRRRLEPPLPDDFIGNGLAVCWPELPRRVLLEAASSSSLKALAQISLSVQKSQKALDNKYFRNMVAYLDRVTDDADTLQWGPAFPTTNLIMATWRSQDTQQLDWGEEIGVCEAVRTRMPFPHTVTILPKRPGAGRVEILLCFTEPVLDQVRQSALLGKFGIWVDDDGLEGYVAS